MVSEMRCWQKSLAGQRSYPHNRSRMQCYKRRRQRVEIPKVFINGERSKATMAKNKKQVSDDPRVFALIGYGVIIFCFVVLSGWAAMTPLASAVVASGVVTTEGNKKTIQHLEGGIIKEILIREGDHVEAGQIIVRLDDTSPKANVEILRNQLYAAVARDAPFSADPNGLADIQFPDELTSASNDAVAAKAIDDQRGQFKERRASL